MRISDWSSDVCSSDLLAHGFGTMTGQGWPVLDGLSRPISLHARKMQQHGEARGPFNERADRGTAKAEDEVAFPMSGDCPVFDLRWSLADHDGFSEERLSTVAGALARQAKGPPRAQAGGEFLTQCPTALDI